MSYNLKQRGEYGYKRKIGTCPAGNSLGFCSYKANQGKIQPEAAGIIYAKPNGDNMDKKEILERKLSQLENLNGKEQKEMFFELFGFECGTTNGRNIVMRLFNKLQEIYLGGVSEDDLTILRKIAEADDRANLKQICKSRNMTQGTRIIKEWKGKIYTVTITADGRYEYEGENYRSLSAVADKITGTHWNGKKFFGVK